MIKNLKKPGRAFIIEPTLLLNVGHVAHCTNLFATNARELGYETIIVVPESAPNNLKIDENFHVNRVLPNTYESFLIDSTKFIYPIRKLIRVASFILGKSYGKKAFFFSDRLVWFLKYSKDTRAIFKNLNDKYSFKATDRVIFPNADHLTLRAYLRFSTNLNQNSRPSLALRFINVMENNGVPKILTSKSIFRLICRKKSDNFLIDVAAETEGYRLHISQFVKGVFLCEYPHEIQHINRRDSSLSKRSGVFVIGALGSARPDKGFIKLSNLLPKILAAFGKRVKVLTQEAIVSWGFEYEKTAAELRLYPQVNLMPGYLPLSEMQKALDSCDFMLMPYDEGTYEYRGSAMLFEAADRHIPVLVPSRTGLGEVVRKYGIGATFNSEGDIIGSLEALLKIDPKTLKLRFETYNSQRTRNFRKLIEG